MDFAVGENIEAVDECGVWHYAKIVDKRADSVVVTFPPWKPDWDREIFDALEIRERTAEEVLVPRRFANNKFPNLKKLMAGDTVFLSGEGVTVQYSDPIRKLVTVKLHDATIKAVNVWELELTTRETQKDEN